MSFLGYDYTLNSRSVTGLLQASDGGHRLEGFFARSAASPFQRGDYQETDTQGRVVEVVVYESWLVTYWADHAVKLVHIVDIENVG